MNDPFKDYNTLMFCDETKFYSPNGDAEDAIFYFGIAVGKHKVALVNKQFKDVLNKFRIKSNVFHASDIFKRTRPRERLMDELCDVFVNNALHCFCFKYEKTRLFEKTKQLDYLNEAGLSDFNNSEFQALFYFLLILNTHLRDDIPRLVSKNIAMYFDRNVYGNTDIEAFNFPHPEFVIKRMTFSEKALISLLALPDFVGYIFRKSKITHNQGNAGDNVIEKDILTINAFKNLLKISENKLFHFLDIDKWETGIDFVLVKDRNVSPTNRDL